MRIAHIIMMAVIGVFLFVSYLATAQDVDYWACGETPGLPEAERGLTSVGAGILGDEVPLAIFEKTDVDQTIACWFDGHDWHLVNLPNGKCSDIAHGPDGKVWLKFWSWLYPGAMYIDEDGYHEPRVTSGSWIWLYCGWSIDVVSWRGLDFLLVGGDPLDYYAASFASYCEPSCDEVEFVGHLDGGGGGEMRCAVSGDYLAMQSWAPLRIIELTGVGFWDLPVSVDVLDPQGTNSYFWVHFWRYNPGLLQIDATTRSYHMVDWAEGIAVGTTVVSWQGMWLLGKSTNNLEHLLLAYWSFHENEPVQIREIPPSMGTELYSGVSMTPPSKIISLTTSGHLWFTTEKAVGRWRLEGIPMPYEARVEAQAKEGGAVEVEIEFDNLRIIRNDAMLHLKIECLGVDDEEPVWLSASYQVYHEFQPQETFRYSFQYVPIVLPSMDRIRYSVHTTYIDVNAPPADEEIITSNIATAEVRLD